MSISQEDYSQIALYVNYFARKWPFLVRFQDQEDLVQTVCVKFLRFNHMEKFNSKITSRKYHIMNGVKTTMIDMIRREKNRREEINLEVPISSEEGSVTLLDTISSFDADPSLEEEFMSIYSQLYEVYGNEWGPEYDVPVFGKTRRSLFVAYMLFLIGYSKTEIGVFFGVSKARAGQMVREVEKGLVRLGIKEAELIL